MLSSNLKELRNEKGMTQAELAEKIGVTQGAVYFWEKGINEPTAGYLIKMASLFSISVDELLSFNEEFVDDKNKNDNEISRIFSKLNREQQTLILSIAKEFLKG